MADDLGLESLARLLRRIPSAGRSALPGFPLCEPIYTAVPAPVVSVTQSASVAAAGRHDADGRPEHRRCAGDGPWNR